MFAGVAVLLAAGAGAALVVAVTGSDARSGGPIPVVLVAGYGGTPDSISNLTAHVASQRRKVVPVALPSRGIGPIEDSARVLADAVDATGSARVDLVGFSAGAIVVRAYIQHLDGARRARHVVLLGAPNHGANLASLAASLDPSLCFGACADLTPGSSLLDQLNKDDPTPSGPDYTSIYSADDQTVAPQTSPVLTGAANVQVQDVCPGAVTSHGDLVNQPLPVGLAVEALSGSLDVSSPGACAKAQREGD